MTLPQHLARPAAWLSLFTLWAASLLPGACGNGDETDPLGTGAGSSSTGTGATAGDGGMAGGSGGGGGAGEICNGEDDDGDGEIDEGLEETCGACGRPYDLEVVVDYPIFATWMYARNDACQWQETLESFHRQGGQAVWQFGPHFGEHSAETLKTHPEFAACMEDGVHCVDRALADLIAADPNNTVASWLSYEFNEHYSDAILACPALDRKIQVGERTYWRIVLPHQSGQSPCVFDGGTYDVLLTWFEGVESSSLMLDTADRMGLDVYLGMPSAPPLSAQPWNVDTALRPAYLDWARRVLEDYASRHGGHPSFAGVYQSFEVSLQSSGLNGIYDTYGMVGDIVHAVLPDEAYVLSPYWDVNTAQGNQNVGSVKEGFKRLARQGADIIAPQDGRGTGKSALYWPFQGSETIQSIDPQLAAFPNVDGAATFGQQFNASTGELFDACRAAVGELEGESISVELWANLEAFENLTAAPCGFSWALQRTDKARLDWALTMAGAQPSRTISFMWDAYYTCTDGGSEPPLHEQITTDGDRPIAAYGRLEGNSIVLRGYHLAVADTTFLLTWYDGQWNVQGAAVSPNAVVPGWGAANGRMVGLDQVTLPFDASNLAPSFYVHVRPVGPGDLQAHHSISLAY